MSVDDAIPSDLTPDERAEIRRHFAKGLLILGLGILLTLICFWAPIAGLVIGLDHAANSETISLTSASAFFRSSAWASTCCSEAWPTVLFTPVTAGIRRRFAIAAPIITCGF